MRKAQLPLRAHSVSDQQLAPGFQRRPDPDTVEVSDGKVGNGSMDAAIDASIAVTTNLTDMEPLLAPATPTVAAASGAIDSLTVTWAAPDNVGRPAIV